MEKELNIAAILKEKPVGTKLYSPCCGVCKKGNYGNSERPITLCLPNRVLYHLLGNGKEFEAGEIMVYPSKQMRDWSKFAWKKGDVLATDINTLCIFEGWVNDEYTQFKAKYNTRRSDWHFYSDEVKPTCDWAKLTDDDVISQYISKIEEHYSGKLNLDTLRIEKHQFKDGDIVFVECVEEREADYIVICKNINNHKISDYCSLNINSSSLDYTGENGLLLEFYKLRLATEEEKQRLFDALAKENKAWDAEKKQIVDLPKKFKVLDYILIKNIFRTWQLHQYAFDNKYSIITVGGAAYSKQCKILPYSEQTAHLLGTTDDWKGGEE